MTDDERFDTWLKDAAADYNRPAGDVPRELMWSVIQPAIATPVVTHRRWRVSRWVPAVAAAAVLMAVAYQAGVSRGQRRPEAIVAGVTPAEVNPGYEMATRAHLERADALLTSTRTALDEASAELDPAVSSWARDVLTDTRLLLDSPAGRAGDRRQLLEDLELTLAQIVQLSAAASPDDRRLVERLLRRGELLARIRHSVPASVRGT